jgi:LDH2 family malate/lactate/ureidoglycolate dehydrogenase
MERSEYNARIDSFAASARAAPPRDAGHPIRLPGDRRREIAALRRVDGIPLPLKLVEELILAAQQYAPSVKVIL